MLRRRGSIRGSFGRSASFRRASSASSARTSVAVKRSSGGRLSRMRSLMPTRRRSSKNSRSPASAGSPASPDCLINNASPNAPSPDAHECFATRSDGAEVCRSPRSLRFEDQKQDNDHQALGPRLDCRQSSPLTFNDIDQALQRP